MKLLLSLFAFMIFLAFPANSQWTEVKQSQLVVNGSATMTYMPDRVQFSFGVRGLGSTLDEAVKEATAKVLRVATKLQQVGITDKQIRTSFFNSADNPDGRSWWSSSKDFAAAYQMVITLDSVFDLVEPALAAIASEPVENLSRLEYSLRNDPAKRLEACNAAAQDARRKAEQLAATLGASISNVLYVEDQSQGPIPLPGLPVRGVSDVLALQAGVKTVFSPSQINVEGRVKVIFELARKQ